MRIQTTAILMTAAMLAAAQTSTEDARQSLREQYESFMGKARKEYSDFRDKANAEYADFIEKAWKACDLDAPEAAPVHEDVAPIEFSDDEHDTEAIFITADQVTIMPRISRFAAPQPQPVSPIKEVATVDPGTVPFTFYGTDCSVRFDDGLKFSLANLDRHTIADAWRKLAEPDYNNTIADCLKLRDNLHLNDWAYLQMLDTFTKTAMGDGDAARLFMAFLYTQSGYKSRLIKTMDDDTPMLSMLFGTESKVYNRPALRQDNILFYPLHGRFNRVEYVDCPFPSEQPVSLSIDYSPTLATSLAEPRELKSTRYPDVKATVQVDKNLIDFYNDYPAWAKGENFLTRWAFYAQTPMHDHIRNTLYPQLAQSIDTEDKNMGVEHLLNFVQTAFVYEYDDKVWGADRAFFGEETLYYPFCDCEDRAILFSHLVRDILGMDVALIYYPGHLATAVLMEEGQQGDYLYIDGDKYTICDPTYIGAKAGRSMPNLDKSKIQVIRLD